MALSVIGSFTMPMGSSADYFKRVFRYGNYLIALRPDTSPRPTATILDVSDPTAPTLVAHRMSTVAGFWQGAVKSSNWLYLVGSSSASFGTGARVTKVDLTQLPLWVETTGTYTATNEHAGGPVVLPSGRLAVQHLSSAPTSRWRTWDVSGTPTVVSTSASANTSDPRYNFYQRQAVLADGPRVFHTAWGTTVLRRVSYASELAPTLEGTTTLPTSATSSPRGIEARGDYLWVLTSSSRIVTYDVSTPSAPVQLANNLPTGVTREVISAFNEGVADDALISAGDRVAVHDGPVIGNPTDSVAIGTTARDAIGDADAIWVVADQWLYVIGHDYGGGWTVGSIKF
ncbi:MAG TPA: hypothetical protein VM345_01885 [Acidimicrobiales bacterium]|nr:hypothetical protein [Acidimicrobiales bacterium]